MGEFFKEFRAADHGIFDDLGAAAAVFLRRQGRQTASVAEDQGGLIEGPGLVLPPGQVHPRLASHGGIHGGQEGGGELHVGNAPAVGGGGEAAQIPGDAAPQGQKQILPGELRLA